MAIQQRLVFRLMVGTVPNIEENKGKRLSELVHQPDFNTREFVGVEPDGDYRLGEVMDGMFGMATNVIQAGARIIDVATTRDQMKVMFMEFTVQDGGVTVGLDLKS